MNSILQKPKDNISPMIKTKRDITKIWRTKMKLQSLVECLRLITHSL